MHCQMVHDPEQPAIKKRNKKAKEGRRFMANILQQLAGAC
jgi:hypothetical protein